MTSPQPLPAIVVVDIDGTFLDPRGRVLPGTRAEFARARRAGATIVLASGRPIAGLRNLLSRVRLDLDGIVLAGSNGSIVVDADSGEVLARHSIEDEAARRLLAFAADLPGVCVMVCDGDDLVVDDPDHPQVAVECQGNDLRLRVVDDLRSVAPGEVRADKVLLFAPPEVLRPAAEAVRAEFGDDVESSFSAPFYFEATAPGVDKGSALADVAEHLGVAVTSSVAFGDNGNDLPMIRRAGLGVAMGNAIREVRDAADRVTDSNADEGIAHVLADVFGDGNAADPVPEPETEGVYPDGFDVVLNDEDPHPTEQAADPGADPSSTRGTTV